MNHELIEIVKSKYGEVVRMAHMHDFTANENRKATLTVWFDERNKTDGGLALSMWHRPKMCPVSDIDTTPTHVILFY